MNGPILSSVKLSISASNMFNNTPTIEFILSYLNLHISQEFVYKHI